MKAFKKSILVTALLLYLITVRAQVNVVSIQLMPYNVTPEAMLSASVMNNGDAQQAEIVSRLYNFNNEILLTVQSAPFVLNKGLNSSQDGSRKVSAFSYGSGNQVEYLRTSKGLPTGTFRICVTVITSKAQEPQDEFCDEIESDFNQFLYLVYPADKDTIDSKSPLLNWTHSEPFSVLAQGESYRMIVTAVKEKQSAEEAIAVNEPLMMKNYLTTHNLQYPYDAKELVEGGHYAWQVQKTANGVVTNKTEAWEFYERKKPEEIELKYVALKSTVDANFYITTGKIYFKFSEEYNSKGEVLALITSDDGKKLPVTIQKDQKESTSTGSNIKKTGDNRFILDLDKDKIKPGFYTMQIMNEKKEVYYLKFHLLN
ncbi:MAG: hypothetical protein ACJ77K_06325 [Bacteroidia bacterium]